MAHALLAELNEPMLSATLLLPGEAAPPTDPAQIRSRLEHEVDLVVDAGFCGAEPTTVLDLTGDEAVVLRALEKDRNQRFASCKEMSRALAASLAKSDSH